MKKRRCESAGDKTANRTYTCDNVCARVKLIKICEHEERMFSKHVPLRSHIILLSMSLSFHFTIADPNKLSNAPARGSYIKRFHRGINFCGIDGITL
jgi:hypothetical protein